MWEKPTFTNGPFQDLTQALYKYKNGLYQCLKPQDMPANHMSVYFQESQGMMWEHPTILQTALFRILPKHPTNIRTAHFSVSSHRTRRPITSQFISTNHRGWCGNIQRSLEASLFRSLSKHSTNIRTAHISASSHRTCRPITSQFISQNQRGWCGNIPHIYKRPFSGPYPSTVQI